MDQHQSAASSSAVTENEKNKINQLNLSSHLFKSSIDPAYIQITMGFCNHSKPNGSVSFTSAAAGICILLSVMVVSSTAPLRRTYQESIFSGMDLIIRIDYVTNMEARAQNVSDSLLSACINNHYVSIFPYYYLKLIIKL